MRNLLSASPGSALILSVGARILQSRTLTPGQQSEIAAMSDKSLSPQNEGTNTLQRCAPRI